MIQYNPSQHGTVQQRREVMMEVQHSGHRPEWYIMQDPSEEEPLAGVCYLAALLKDNGVVDAAPLFAHGCVNVKNNEYCKKDYVSPPNDGITEQVYSLIVSGEELPLKIRISSEFAAKCQDACNEFISQNNLLCNL